MRDLHAWGYCAVGRNNDRVHFTLWPSLTQSKGGHAEIDWPAFLFFVANPVEAEDKKTLEGWSPAKFADNRRRASACEIVSCIVLDDDSSGLSLEALLVMWGDVAGVVHSSHSSTPDAPKWRIVLRCSRDMTPAEHARVWAAVRDVARARGQVVDEATKDPSRLWFRPAHKPGAVDYVWHELKGEPLPVDEVLRCSTTAASSTISTASKAASESSSTGIAASSGASSTADRRRALAAALGSAWPAKGRHEAQLALAGALRAEGFTEPEAVDFLCAVCRAAGDEDRPKREATIRHTYAREAGASLTGWTRLKAFVDPVVVDAVRSGVARGADFNATIAQRLEQAAQATKDPDPWTAPDGYNLAPRASEPGQAPGPGLGFEYGVWEKEPPPIEFLVDGLIPRGCVGMFFGRADTLKTWLLYSLGLAVATGKPWLSRYNVPKSARVGIVDFETGTANVDRRLFMLGAGNVQNLGRKSFAKLKPNDPEFWIALAAERFDLVIVDSLRRANPGANENESGEAIVPLELAAEFSEVTKAAVLFIHHAKKDTADGWPEFRGSGAIEDQVDVSFAVKKTDTSAEVKTVDVMCIKPGDMRTPAPFVVEITFDDKARKAMLRQIEAKPKVEQNDEAALEEHNREKVFTVLRSHSSGVPQNHLINVMTGRKQTKFDLLSRLVLAGVIVEYRERGKTIVMLKPEPPKTSGE